MIRIEKNIDRTASALFAMACAYAIGSGLKSDLEQHLLGIAVLATAVLSYLLSSRSLAAIGARPRKLPVPIFDVRQVEAMDGTELLLTERFDVPPTGEEPLLLQDMLAVPEPDSRVVRLFDRTAMPAAGEMKSQIEPHFDCEFSAARTSEAAQALHDALAELRRSLS